MSYTISWEPLRFTDFTYKIIIETIPKLLSADYDFKEETWGFSIANQEHTMSFLRDGSQYPWTVTHYVLYTKEIMKILILMVEYGVTYNLSHDDTDMSLYLEALDEVEVKHYLRSYEWQKKYFVELGLVKSKVQ
jgi:hypothetical protein